MFASSTVYGILLAWPIDSTVTLGERIQRSLNECPFLPRSGYSSRCGVVCPFARGLCGFARIRLELTRLICRHKPQTKLSIAEAPVPTNSTSVSLLGLPPGKRLKWEATRGIGYVYGKLRDKGERERSVGVFGREPGAFQDQSRSLLSTVIFKLVM